MRASFVVLVACLAYALGLPTASVQGEAGTIFLDCTYAANDPLYPYRCRPMRYLSRNSLNREEQTSDEEDEEENAGHGMTSLALTVPQQISLFTPTCLPHQLYVPHLNMCQDMVPFRISTRVVSPIGGPLFSPQQPDCNKPCPEGQIMIEACVCVDLDAKPISDKKGPGN